MRVLRSIDNNFFESKNHMFRKKLQKKWFFPKMVFVPWKLSSQFGGQNNFFTRMLWLIKNFKMLIVLHTFCWQSSVFAWSNILRGEIVANKLLRVWSFVRGLKKFNLFDECRIYFLTTRERIFYPRFLRLNGSEVSTVREPSWPAQYDKVSYSLRQIFPLLSCTLIGLC